MQLLDRLPPRPALRTVALWVTVVLLVRALLLSVYVFLGDVQAGRTGLFGLRLVDEFSGALTALPLLAIVAWGSTRWPLGHLRWRRNVVPLLLLFVVFSGTHTVAMETARWLFYPLIGHARDYSTASLSLAVGHEMPNDLFNFALVVAALELWQVWWQAHERERRDADVRRSLVESQLTSLRLQLQPHFLFNALNTVSATMYEDPQRADSMLGELSELLRASLRSPRSDEVPLHEEVGIAERYVRLQHERFGGRLTVTFDIPEACTVVRVPVFVLQPLIENAVRHGRVERHGTGIIRVTARRADGTLSLEVWDDGDDHEVASTGNGLGLRATGERLRLLYGTAATFTAGPVDGGWRAHLTLPCREDA